MELRFDAMLYSSLGNENSDADHIKRSLGPQVPHTWFSGCYIILFTSHKFEQKNNVLVKTLTFSLVTVVLADVRDFKLVIG